MTARSFLHILRTWYAWFVPLLGLFILSGFVSSDYRLVIMIIFLLYCLYAVALNVIMGYAGQFAVSNPAFAAIGAFGSAALVINLGLPFWVALAFVLAVVAMSAAFMGYIALRFTAGIFLAVITIAFVGLMLLIIKLPVLHPYTGGTDGLTTNYVVSLGAIRLDSYREWYFVLLVVLGLVSLIVYRLTHSRTGRAWIALREDEALACSLGIQPTYYKTLAFVISSLIAALAGALYAPIFKFISEGNFTIEVAILHVTTLLIGGLGSFSGPYLGAAIFVMVPELLRPIVELRLAVFGLILIVVILFMRGGVFGLLRRYLGPYFEAPPGDSVSGLDSMRGQGKDDSLGIRGDPLKARPDVQRSRGVILEGRSLSKSFGGIEALVAVDFQLWEGEILGLIGPNGAGKTTLFHLLSGFERPGKGRVFFRGVDSTGLPAQRCAESGLVRTFQELRVFPDLTVWQHIMVARHLRGKSGLVFDVLGGSRVRRVDEANKCHAVSLLRICGLEECWNTAGKDLSYGETKKLGVAMALAAGAQVLLLDEPAAGLSAEGLESISNLIRRVNAEGVSLIVVEHNVPFITGIAHRLIALDMGRKIAEGTPQEVVSDERVVSAYLGD